MLLTTVGRQKSHARVRRTADFGRDHRRSLLCNRPVTGKHTTALVAGSQPLSRSRGLVQAVGKIPAPLRAFRVTPHAQAGWNRDLSGMRGAPTYVKYPSKYVKTGLEGAYKNAAAQ